jgi:hypothetical protein
MSRTERNGIEGLSCCPEKKFSLENFSNPERKARAEEKRVEGKEGSEGKGLGGSPGRERGEGRAGKKKKKYCTEFCIQKNGKKIGASNPCKENLA